MALLKLSGMLSAMSGKVGGSIVGTSQNGVYLKQNSFSQQHPSEAQQYQRTQLYPVSQHWRTLSTSQKQTFIDGAVNFPYTNRVGDTAYYTGYQLHNLLNQGRLKSGLSLLDTCPSFPNQVVNYILFTYATTARFYYGIDFTGSQADVNFYIAPESTDGSIPKPSDYRLQYTQTISGSAFAQSFDWADFNNYPYPTAGSVIFAYFKLVDRASGYTVFTSDVQNHTVV